MDKNKEYGLIYYDIPSNNMELYKEVKKIINTTCLPVNMSVYVFDWGLKSTIEKRLKHLNAFSLADISMMKFDKTSHKDLERVAEDQLQKIFQSINNRIAVSMTKFKERIKKKQTLDRLSKKLNEYESLLTLYSFTGRAESSLNMLRDIIKHEHEVLENIDKKEIKSDAQVNEDNE